MVASKQKELPSARLSLDEGGKNRAFYAHCSLLIVAIKTARNLRMSETARRLLHYFVFGPQPSDDR